jgi:hypothetical protein
MFACKPKQESKPGYIVPPVWCIVIFYFAVEVIKNHSVCPAVNERADGWIDARDVIRRLQPLCGNDGPIPASRTQTRTEHGQISPKSKIRVILAAGFWAIKKDQGAFIAPDPI